MRRIWGKLIQVAGAIACLLALILGLGITPAGYGSLAWEVVLLVLGVVLLVGGTLVGNRTAD